VSTKKVNFESNPFKVVFNNFIQTFKLNTQTMIFFIAGAFALYIAYIIVYVITLVASIGLGESSGSTSSVDGEGVAVAGIVISGVAALAIWLVALMVAGMANHAAYMTHQKKKTTIADSFNETLSRFGTLFVVSLIWIAIYIAYFAAAILGTLALGELTNYWIGSLVAIFFGVIIIRFWARYIYVMYPVFAHKMSAFKAFKHTKKVTKGHLVEILSQAIINNLVAQFSMGVITLPIYVSTVSTMYPQMEASNKANQKTKVHWANWLIIALIGLMIAVFGGIMALIIAFSDDVNESNLNNNEMKSIFDDDYSNDFDDYNLNFDLDN